MKQKLNIKANRGDREKKGWKLLFLLYKRGNEYVLCPLCCNRYGISTCPHIYCDMYSTVRRMCPSINISKINLEKPLPIFFPSVIVCQRRYIIAQITTFSVLLLLLPKPVYAKKERGAKRNGKYCSYYVTCSSHIVLCMYTGRLACENYSIV